MTIAEIFNNLNYGPAPEAAELAQAWLEAHQGSFGIYIGGEFRASHSGGQFETDCPATGEPLAKIALGGPEDVDAAVKAARAAQPNWESLGGHGRAKVLYALARQVQKHSRLLAVLETLDNGKPIRETRDIDVPLVARHFYHHAGWAQIFETEFSGYRPVGVCGQIIPWNFPLLMLAWKIAPALAAGNTVVLKPAEFTSLTALCFAELCDAAGVPPGVVNIVTGEGETGRLIVEHPGIDKIAFTGSTEVGRLIRKATAGTGKKLSLELGGKSPFIVFEDADLDSAVEGLVDAIWFNQGQVCCAGSRLLVQESCAERFLSKLKDRMATLRMGDPLDKAVDIGAIIAPVQLERIAGLVEQSRNEGAEVYQAPCEIPARGWFYPPTLLSNVSPASTAAQVEIFGPVLAAMTFRTPAEAVALANNTVYGLAASVWSENLSLALDVAGQVKSGTVWVNSTNLFDAASGFGGYRESGFGREGGSEGLLEYLVFDRLGSSPRKPAPKPSKREPTSPPGIDRTYKLYIGGKQVRPDQGFSLEVVGSSGRRLGEVSRANRKDVRNAVEAARNAQPGWAAQTGHARAQVLYYLAENLSARGAQFAELLAAMSGSGFADGEREVGLCVERLFECAAWADKYDGRVHGTAFRGITYTLNEPVGVIAATCPDGPGLLPLVATLGVCMAMGNACVVAPSETTPLAAAEFIQVLETSDVPAGVVNLLTGLQSELRKTLAEHDGVDAMWHFGDAEGGRQVELLSVGNLKQTWLGPSKSHDWSERPWSASKEFLRHATQVKNVWAPLGE
ncbi:MAG: aldehyde dehydrogenase family protein [Armatimonadetes bacterium]|nr:aldehyde dehydrogenase family protein [Armatimonadota bacterium]